MSSITFRDYLFRLSLDGLALLEESSWPAADDLVRLCQDKGQSEEDCHNYIRVLHVQGERVLACGTNAFSPRCSWRPIEAIDVVSEWSSGVARYVPRPLMFGIFHKFAWNVLVYSIRRRNAITLST